MSGRPRLPRGPSQWELTFEAQIKTLGLPVPEREYRLAQKVGRLWRFDFAWPKSFVAVEIEGLTTFGGHLGRHQTAAGFAADCEKYNQALLMGWAVLRLTPNMLTRPYLPGEPLPGVYQIRALLEARGLR